MDPLITDQDVLTDSSLSDELRELDPQHPALARMKIALTADAPADQFITSYDRMHHRHSRS